MKKALLVIVGVIALLIVGGIMILSSIGNVLGGVTETGDAFMTAIQNEELDTAYAMLSTELMAEVSEENFVETFTNSNLESWEFAGSEVSASAGEQGRANLNGTAMFGGSEFDIVLNFVNQDDSWKLIGFNFEPT